MTIALRIRADDLTGALDAAAPFAGSGGPVEVPWVRGPGSPGGRLAASSESRDAGREEAVMRTLATLGRIGGAPAGPLWFKKVDSVLRGHPVAETAALMRAGGFRRCVFAPAFPELGRVTRGGRQWLRGPRGEHPVGLPDLAAAFAEEGLLAAAAGGPVPPGAAVLIVDAETSDDFLAAVEAQAGSERVLWAGSRGLAAALAGPFAPRPSPPVGAVVVGTSRPATRAQVRALEPRAVRIGPAGPLTFDCARPALIDPVAEAADAEATRRALAAALAERTPAGDDRAGLIVVGGDTLSPVLEATRARALSVLGEVGPGVPLAEIRGGSLDGRRMVTKSGGFGPPGLVVELLSQASDGVP